MARGIRSVSILGNGVEAWLTACVMARFVVTDPRQVSVVVSNELPIAQTLIGRPDMARLHRAIGLDVRQKVLGVEVATWPVDAQRSIPFHPYGKPLGGVGFQHFWTRAARENVGPDLSAYNRALMTSKKQSGAWRLDGRSYAQALEAIARQAGVGSTTQAHSEKTDLIVETRSSKQGALWCNKTVAVGCAALPVRLKAGLGLHVLHTSLMTFISCLPDADLAQIERLEYARRIEAMRPCLEDMQDLLLDDVETNDLSERLAHRIDVWSACGRVLPVDHDPFEAHEWIAAMLNAGKIPQGYSRLADNYSLKKVRAHLNDNLVEEVGDA